MTSFNLSSELAHMLATLSVDKLVDLYGKEGLLLARFIQGREKRELAAPTEDECVFIAKWIAELMAFNELVDMTIRGDVFIDVDSDGIIKWVLSADGRDKFCSADT